MTLIPMVIEESGRGERSFDIFSRLLRDRIVFIGSDFNDSMSSTIVAQLLFLASEDEKKDIYLYINSPGGVVTSGLAIYDTINYIKPDVVTICMGQACSMGSFLLSSGTKGRRLSLPETRIMCHQVSGGHRGTAADMEISMKETLRLNDRLLEIMAKNCGKKAKELKEDFARDKWMTATEAKEYGLIDKIITSDSEV